MRSALGMLLFGIALAAAPAAAQDDAANRATARQLFEEGVTFVDAEQWEDAADRFGRALALYDSAVIRFNLARVQAELGLVVQAAEHLRNVARREDAGEDVRAAATELLTTVEPRVARLTIHVDGDADEILRDDAPLPDAMLDVPIAVDPGDHTIAARRDEEIVASETVTLGDGEARTLSLLVPPPVVIAPPPPPPPPPPVTEIWEEWWFWTIIGVVVIGAGVGIGVGVAVSQDGCTGPFMPCRLELP